jgi:protocatechuate 3,4-dioxygenase beta subunit
MTLSRRRCLLLGLGAVACGTRVMAGPQGLDQFMTNTGPPCSADEQTTPSVPADTTYKAGAPMRARLADPGLPGTPLALAGTVTGVTCGRITGATVELWQADASGAYDTAGFRLRGRQVTDADGRFHFDTIVPGRSGTRARHLGLKVVVPGKTTFWTELFFPGDSQNAADPRFKPALLLKMVQAPAGRQAAVFDVILKL